MIVVLDTSSAVEIVLKRRHYKRLAKTIEEAEWIIAPMLFISEASNVFWKYYRFENLSMEKCESFIQDALALVDDFTPETELNREAFGLACLTRQPVYDMFFLALARRHNAHLVTLDKELIKTAKKQSIRLISL